MNCQEVGLCVAKKRYNVFCYADDLLLASTTVTGLQTLINVANEYIVKHGLRFNPKKTNCIVNGNVPFMSAPKWSIEDDNLEVVDNMKYLGTVIGNSCGNSHVNEWLRACSRAFYSLQGTGLCNNGLKIETAVHVWNTTCKSILLYGCNTMYINKTCLARLDKLQAKLIKTVVGIGPRYHSSPLLDALKIPKVSLINDAYNLFLYRNSVTNISAATCFYRNVALTPSSLNNGNSLPERVLSICKRSDVNLLKFLTDNSYAMLCKRKILNIKKNGECGLTDTIRNILLERDNMNIDILRLLLAVF